MFSLRRIRDTKIILLFSLLITDLQTYLNTPHPLPTDLQNLTPPPPPPSCQNQSFKTAILLVFFSRYAVQAYIIFIYLPILTHIKCKHQQRKHSWLTKLLSREKCSLYGARSVALRSKLLIRDSRSLLLKITVSKNL